MFKTKVFSKVKRSILFVLSHIPIKFVGELLLLANKILGKGLIFTLKDEVKAIRNIVLLLKPESFVFLDIGANVGNYSLELKNYFSNHKIIAFEPSPATFDKLLVNVGKKSGIVCVNSALSDFSGMSELFFNEPLSGLASLSKRDLSRFGISFNQSERVKVQTLENYLIQNQLYGPFILKIDVEGHELKVLNGCLSLLTNQIALIQFEFGGTNLDSRTFYLDFYNFFDSINFLLYRLKPNGAYLINRYDELDELPLNSTYYALNKIFLARNQIPKLIRS
jgi:FkbM family methyltransferase